MDKLKKNWFSILLTLIVLVFVFNPFGIGIKVKAFFIESFSSSPTLLSKEARVKLKTYNWNLIDLKDNSLDFNNTKGKVVFVSFWATWCPPCIAEMPSIQKLYNDYKDKIVFVLVSDEKSEKLKSFLEKNNYNLPIYSNTSTILKEFESRSIPASFLVNKNGEIVIDKRGAADWNSSETRKIIDELL